MNPFRPVMRGPRLLWIATIFAVPFAGHLEADVDAAFEMRLEESLYDLVAIGFQLPLIVNALGIYGGQFVMEFRLGHWPDNSRFGGDWANRASGFGDVASTLRPAATAPADMRPQRLIDVQTMPPFAAMVESGGLAFFAGECGAEKFAGGRLDWLSSFLPLTKWNRMIHPTPAPKAIAFAKFSLS